MKGHKFKDYRFKGTFDTHFQAESMAEAMNTLFEKTPILQNLEITYAKEFDCIEEYNEKETNNENL